MVRSAIANLWRRVSPPKLKLYSVGAWDIEEYKGNPSRGRFVFADSAEDAFAFWHKEWNDHAGDDEGFIFDCVVELPVRGQRGVAYGVVMIEGTAPECRR